MASSFWFLHEGCGCAIANALFATSIAILVAGCGSATDEGGDETAAAAVGTPSSAFDKELRFAFVASRSTLEFAAVVPSRAEGKDLDVTTRVHALAPSMGRVHATPTNGELRDVDDVSLPDPVVRGATLRIMLFAFEGDRPPRAIAAPGGLNMFEHVTVESDKEAVTFHTVRLATGVKETGSIALPGLGDPHASVRYGFVVLPAKMDDGRAIVGTHFFALTTTAPAFLPGTY